MSSPPIACNDSASVDRTHWFLKEVETHDASLKSYLRSSFPAIKDVDDVAQESYLRMWKRCATDPIRSAKAFLFKMAQRVALDTVRRQRRSPVEYVADLSRLGVLDGAPDAHGAANLQEKSDLLIEAIDALPKRCREVVILRKIKLLHQRETADLLGISEKGVEIQLSRGLERCREFMRRRGVADFMGDGS